MTRTRRSTGSSTLTSTTITPGSAAAQAQWNYSVRLSGTYSLPWGILYGSSFTAQSGEYYFREVQVRNALNANVQIRVEPQADQYPWVKIWDNRISKRFKLKGSMAIEGMIDLFNSLNTNTVTAQTNRNGPTYLQPTEIIAARVFRLGASATASSHQSPSRAWSVTAVFRPAHDPWPSRLRSWASTFPPSLSRRRQRPDARRGRVYWRLRVVCEGLPVHAEFVIVGGGIYGVATAWALARAAPRCWCSKRAASPRAPRAAWASAAFGPMGATCASCR